MFCYCDFTFLSFFIEAFEIASRNIGSGKQENISYNRTFLKWKTFPFLFFSSKKKKLLYFSDPFIDKISFYSFFFYHLSRPLEWRYTWDFFCCVEKEEVNIIWVFIKGGKKNWENGLKTTEGRCWTDYTLYGYDYSIRRKLMNGPFLFCYSKQFSKWILNRNNLPWFQKILFILWKHFFFQKHRP